MMFLMNVAITGPRSILGRDKFKCSEMSSLSGITQHTDLEFWEEQEDTSWRLGVSKVEIQCLPFRDIHLQISTKRKKLRNIALPTNFKECALECVFVFLLYEDAVGKWYINLMEQLRPVIIKASVHRKVPAKLL